MKLKGKVIQELSSLVEKLPSIPHFEIKGGKLILPVKYSKYRLGALQEKYPDLYAKFVSSLVNVNPGILGSLHMDPNYLVTTSQSDIIPVNHLRALKKAYLKNQWEGVNEYIISVKKRYELYLTYSKKS